MEENERTDSSRSCQVFVSPNHSPPGSAETESYLTLSKPLPFSGPLYFSSAKPKYREWTVFPTPLQLEWGRGSF